MCRSKDPRTRPQPSPKQQRGGCFEQVGRGLPQGGGVVPSKADGRESLMVKVKSEEASSSPTLTDTVPGEAFDTDSVTRMRSTRNRLCS